MTEIRDVAAARPAAGRPSFGADCVPELVSQVHPVEPRIAERLDGRFVTAVRARVADDPDLEVLAGPARCTLVERAGERQAAVVGREDRR